MTVFLTKHPWAAGSGLLSRLLGTLLATAPALMSSSASGSPPGTSDVPCSQVSPNRASIAGESVEAAESDALPVSTVKVWATVYDQATIDAWNASGYIPAFLDGVQVDDVPLDQAVCDLDVIAPDASGEWYHLKMRVRSSDGAIAAVFMEPVIVPADPIPVDYPTGEPSRGSNGGAPAEEAIGLVKP